MHFPHLYLHYITLINVGGVANESALTIAYIYVYYTLIVVQTKWIIATVLIIIWFLKCTEKGWLEKQIKSKSKLNVNNNWVFLAPGFLMSNFYLSIHGIFSLL